VKDLDPTVERVILRCLDADPRNRPSSALNVAMALPGGDPIAAALAAGETPSPEMVAASGEKEGLQPRTAIACFVGVVLMLVAVVLLSGKTTLLGRAPLPLPPDALADRARVMLKQFGYTEEPVDWAYGFTTGLALPSYERYLRAASSSDHRWEHLPSHQPALTVFWYRQHQAYLQPGYFLPGRGTLANSVVGQKDPPLTAEGMVRIALDANGRLESLDALPSLTLSHTAAGQRVDWSGLLKAAGLDDARFTQTTPEAFIPLNQNARMAWTGTYEEGRPDKITVEGAALDGRPVYFRIFGPWTESDYDKTSAVERFVNISLEVLLVALLVAAALVAWSNVRLGRGDRKGAWRVAAVMFASGVASWALVAAHVPAQWEVYLLVMGLSWAGFQGGLVGLLYLAIEPFIRRHWPDALISWMRMVNGRLRDPLAASHLLVGVSAGVVTTLLVAVAAMATNGLTDDRVIGASVSGARFLFGNLLGILVLYAFVATGIVLVLVLLRSVVRRTWVADALCVVLLSVVLTPPYPVSIATTIGWLLKVLALAMDVWILRRFGLLALVANVCVYGLLKAAPLAVASWFAAYSLTTPTLLAAVAAWTLYVILTSRPGRASRSAAEPLV
jgi:serine/threonine-protein kinase